MYLLFTRTNQDARCGMMAYAKFALIFCCLAVMLCKASPTTASIFNNEAFVANSTDFGDDVLTQLSPDQSSLNTPTVTVVATVSEVQATLCTQSADHFHCITTSTSVTSTITSYTISTTITTPTPTSSKSAGLPALKNPISKPINALKRWLDPDYLTRFCQENNHLPTMVTESFKCPSGSATPRIPCGIMCIFTFFLALFPALRAHDVRDHIRAGVFFSGGVWTVARIVIDVTMIFLGFTVCTLWIGLTWYSCLARISRALNFRASGGD